MTSPNQQHHNLEQIRDGREAVALAGILDPYIQERIALITHETISRYRAGTASHDFLLGNAAKLTCLADLLSDLDTRVRRGDVAAHKEMGNAKS